MVTSWASVYARMSRFGDGRFSAARGAMRRLIVTQRQPLGRPAPPKKRGVVPGPDVRSSRGCLAASTAPGRRSTSAAERPHRLWQLEWLSRWPSSRFVAIDRTEDSHSSIHGVVSSATCQVSFGAYAVFTPLQRSQDATSGIVDERSQQSLCPVRQARRRDRSSPPRPTRGPRRSPRLNPPYGAVSTVAPRASRLPPAPGRR